jgi:hypothetical protein
MAPSARAAVSARRFDFCRTDNSSPQATFRTEEDPST